MSYWIEDANGWLGDLASNKGLMDLRRTGPRPLVALLDGEGHAAAVRAAARACDAVPSLRYIADLLKDATAPVIVTDGATPIDATREPPERPVAKAAFAPWGLVPLAKVFEEADHPRHPAGSDQGGEFAEAGGGDGGGDDAAAAIRAAFEPARQRFREGYAALVRRQHAEMVAYFGADTMQRPGESVYNSWRWARIFSGVVRENTASRIDRVPGAREEVHYPLDEEKLAKNADRYAEDSIAEAVTKTQRKLGTLADVRAETGGGKDWFVVTGTLPTGGRVYLRQQMILNVSSRGTPYNQWPARITVDGKPMSEAAYRRMRGL